MAEQKAKVVKVGRGGPRGPRPKVQNPGKIFMRILRYVMECYRIQVVGRHLHFCQRVCQRAGHFVHADLDRWLHPAPAERAEQ